MGTPYLGEIRLFSFNFPPGDWALCNGQSLAINQNQALFSILGTTYGGNGTTTFRLPDLQGRHPVHVGPQSTIGQSGGAETHTLTTAEMPAHTHVPLAATTATGTSPAGRFWGPATNGYVTGASNVSMGGDLVDPIGGSQPHPNMAPFLTINFCICISNGTFPTRP